MLFCKAKSGSICNFWKPHPGSLGTPATVSSSLPCHLVIPLRRTCFRPDSQCRGDRDIGQGLGSKKQGIWDGSVIILPGRGNTDPVMFYACMFSS